MSRNTYKGLVSVALNGVYPGSTSDNKIVKDCGILYQLNASHLVLADQGVT